MLNTIGAVPGREARFDRERLAIAAPSLELHHGAAGLEPCGTGRSADQERRAAFSAGADQIDRLADHLGGGIAKDRLGAPIPERDAGILGGTGKTRSEE